MAADLKTDDEDGAESTTEMRFVKDDDDDKVSAQCIEDDNEAKDTKES